MRGALYIVWGDATEKVLARSVASLSLAMPDLPFHVERLPTGATLLDKARMYDLSPFDETVFLDADTVALKPLDFGFEAAARHGIACSICECPWARRYPSIEGDVVEYNTGVMFFDKRVLRTCAVFNEWKAIAYSIDSSITWDSPPRRMALNDQAGFAKACWDARFSPFVLPRNWNFRPEFHREWFGPLVVWHCYAPVPQNVLSANPDAAAMNYNTCHFVSGETKPIPGQSQ